MRKLYSVLILAVTWVVSVQTFAETATTSTSELDVDEKVKAAVDGQNDPARELVSQVLDRYMGKTEISTLSLMTCPYQIKNKKLSCASDIRKKKVKSLTKNYGENLRDSKGLLLIVEPIAEFGIGILQYDYTNSGQDTDQWLYLPELDQVKRMSSSADAPKKGSLFGSEFALEDVEREKIADYEYRILKTTKIAGRDVTVVEQHPDDERAKKTNYLKRVKWIDSERLIVLKENYYSLSGELMKVSYVSNVEEIDGIWTARQRTMRNLKSQRISMLHYDDVNYNIEIDDEYLTRRVLSDAVYRNRFLNAIDESVQQSSEAKLGMTP